jgi:hypothetical protein
MGCVHFEIDCEDNNLCTRDLCCVDSGCYYAPVCCDDNNQCTIDSCDPYIGCQNVKISCDDGDECTIDRCHCDYGCEHIPVSVEENANCAGWKAVTCSSDSECEDESACTENTCVSGECHTVAKDCDDNDLCTIDSCHKDDGCVHTRVEGPCNSRTEHNTIEELNKDQGTVAQNIQDTSSFSNTATLSVGAIIGIVVGAILAVGIVAVLIVKFKSPAANIQSPDDYQKMN